MKEKVIVVGAGAIGLSIAYELCQRGAQVTVVDRDQVFDSRASSTSSSTYSGSAVATRRSASSWAASGILPPANFDSATDPIDQLRGYSHRLFPRWADQLRQTTGIDCQLERCGGWYLADTPGEIAAMMGMVNYWQELAIECEAKSLAELATKEPLLSPWASSAKAKAWWVPDEYQIRTPSLLAALTAACQANGAELIGGANVIDVDETGASTHVTIDHTGKRSKLIADAIVVCGGSWTGSVAARLKLSHSLIPIRGQILLLDMGHRQLSGVINFGNRYLVPRQNGSVLVGSCEEEVGHQHGTTPSILADLREFIRNVCPELARATQITAWSGLRPMTFDGFPMIGKLPDSDAIYVASGHYRSGIHLAPATAVCIADTIEGATPPLSIQPFAVGKQQQQTTAC
ncbi:NAD(P)/FAD-dependent oxidoreductase [Roseiconus lacunae]|uniref:FAD-dependent oxidoreductase n=1 Tax=Roseiconus lacunae TaxID=2605694 RepID=A0ABT7PJB5_9BACT|nr:FAD-dependent oxidoreductase [Roseiconus lacunae]MDM4016276.1 FAD-dependent oxidoreductase [Roseiconus lacunae]